MYKYQYVTVCFSTGGFMKDKLEEHREIIDRYAADGWRFVTVIPTEIVGYGALHEVDLVFEKEI